MRSKIATVLIVLIAASVGTVGAQHQDHQMPGPQPHIQLATACVQSQQWTSTLAEQLSRRLESARGVNGAGEIRAAVDDLQAGLNQMRAALRSCQSVPESTPAVRPAGTAPAVAPATVIDHSAMGHATPVPQAAPLDPLLVTTCVQTQKAAGVVIDRLDRRLEGARQANSATEMRAGMEEVPAALTEVRASLLKCEPLRAAVAAVPAMDHSKMAMGGTPSATPAAMDHSKMPMGAPAGKPGTAAGAKPAAPMDHSTMPMGGAPAGKPGTAAGAKPAAPMDHSKMPMAGTAPTTGGDHAAMKMDTPKLPVMPALRVPDPACPDNVGQPNAPKAVYRRKVYYFCSTPDRDQFLKDPAAYLKKRPR